MRWHDDFSGVTVSHEPFITPIILVKRGTDSLLFSILFIYIYINGIHYSMKFLSYYNNQCIRYINEDNYLQIEKKMIKQVM